MKNNQESSKVLLFGAKWERFIHKWQLQVFWSQPISPRNFNESQIFFHSSPRPLWYIVTIVFLAERQLVGKIIPQLVMTTLDFLAPLLASLSPLPPHTHTANIIMWHEIRC